MRIGSLLNAVDRTCVLMHGCSLLLIACGLLQHVLMAGRRHDQLLLLLLVFLPVCTTC